jgi:hypothetical protein
MNSTLLGATIKITLINMRKGAIRIFPRGWSKADRNFAFKLLSAV